MTIADDLAARGCRPCKGGLPRLTKEEIEQLLPALPNWQVTADGKRLRREWRARDFAAALAFIQAVGQVAEAENHHPDLHLTNYRTVAVELTTHALGGLTENDFILAARIDRVPIKTKG